MITRDEQSSTNKETSHKKFEICQVKRNHTLVKVSST